MLDHQMVSRYPAAVEIERDGDRAIELAGKVFQLDATGYAYLSASNAGQGNVALTIKGTDDKGSAVGTSQTFNIQFAEETVNGGVYYWDVTDTQIMLKESLAFVIMITVFSALVATVFTILFGGDYPTTDGTFMKSFRS